MPVGLVKCDRCGTEMVRDYGGKRKLRAKIVVWENGKCLGKCQKCGHDVPLPVVLDIPPAEKKTARRHVIINS